MRRSSARSAVDAVANLPLQLHLTPQAVQAGGAVDRLRTNPKAFIRLGHLPCCCTLAAAPHRTLRLRLPSDRRDRKRLGWRCMVADVLASPEASLPP